MASCPKCGKHIKRRNGIRKCKRCGILSMLDLLWWGYLHTEGTLQAKRYFSPEDIQEARESPFVVRTYGPFRAQGRDEALKIVGENT